EPGPELDARRAKRSIGHGVGRRVTSAKWPKPRKRRLRGFGLFAPYRVGAGAADGDDVRVSVTTGYFAHAVIPTLATISVSTSNAGFHPRRMSCPPVAGPRHVRLLARVHAQCRSDKVLLRQALGAHPSHR